MEEYKTVRQSATAEYEEKRSRFIAQCIPVTTEADAAAHIQRIKVENFGARHNVYAYMLKDGGLSRCSDDGEPHSTAGMPTLEVIRSAGVVDCLIVTTRYFGGVLLGTGGLVRAYSGAVQAGLAASTVIEKHHGISLQVTTDYTGIGKIQYIAGERSLPILDSEYTDKVVLKLLVPDDQIEEVKKAITEGTNGRAGLEKDAELYFAKVNGEVKTFEK